MQEEEYLSTTVNGHTFTISKRYNLQNSKILGAGSFGVVNFANLIFSFLFFSLSFIVS
jgi:hypothetical protein